MFHWRHVEKIRDDRFNLPRQLDEKIEVFKRYAKTSGQALAITDLQGRILYINMTASDTLVVRNPKQLEKVSISKFFSMESSEQMKNFIIPFINRHDQWTGDFNLMNNNGDIIPIVLTVFLLKDSIGIPHCLANIFSGITSYTTADKDLIPLTPLSSEMAAQRIAQLEKNNDQLNARIIESVRLTAILEKSPDIIAMTTPQGKILYGNEASRRLFGWLNEAYQREHFIPEVHPAWALTVVTQDGIPQAIAQGAWQGETAIFGPDGREIPVSQTIMAHKSGNGEIQYLSTIMRDISENKRAEKALRESEQRLQAIADAMNQLVWIEDMSGNAIYLNTQFSAYTGLTEVRAKERERMFHPEDLFLIQKKREAGMNPGGAFQVECRIRRHDGEYHWFILREETILTGEGSIKQRINSATDIDELKKTQRALQDNLEILAEAERIGNTGSWKKEAASDLMIVSAGTRRIMGLPENETIPFENFISYIHADDQEILATKVRDISMNGMPFTVEFRLMAPEGNRYIIARAEASRDTGGRWISIHGTIQDITDRKWMEDELIKAQKLESIGTLAAGIAHDYNNLLTGIMGNIELAKVRTVKTDQNFTFLTRAEKSAIAARDLTRHLLTFAGASVPMKKSLRISDTLMQSVKLALTGSNIKPELMIADNLPPVNADENQIHQAIQNIVMNAREAMPTGGKLFVKAESVALGPQNTLSLGEGAYACLTFQDEGKGIPQELLTKIFDPYFSTKDLDSTKGMGLGLSICYSIIKRHDGHISIDSKAGCGTTVVVHIPATQPAGPR